MHSKSVGFGITAHYSDLLRPEGNDFLQDQILSIKENCKYNYKIYIIDNQSEHELNYPDDGTCVYHRVDDQMKTGVTGAWNTALNLMYKDDCDIMLGHSDDIWFDDTIDYFIDHILEDGKSIDRIYAPVSMGLLTNLQRRDVFWGSQIVKNPDWGNCISGFFFGFTKEHYEKYRPLDDQYFSHEALNDNLPEDWKWHGQEKQLLLNVEKGCEQILVGKTNVNHHKIRGWKKIIQLRDSKQL
tara:strand:+ start:320 stop:1042 length:723 start_codon:yes stop_codon:yes gene_type:complete